MIKKLREGIELYDITPSEAISYAVAKVLKCHPELTKKEAKKLVCNSLIYVNPTAEIERHVCFLLGDDDDDLNDNLDEDND